MERKKIYIGDGAYAEYTGWSVLLTAEDGISATDTVSIDSEDFPKLIKFLQDAYDGKL